MLVLPTLRRRLRLVFAFLLAVAIAVPFFGVTTAKAAAASSLPCDIYAADGTPCEAAYSTTRAMLVSYHGPLYQIQRASDNSTLNIGLQSAGGLVDSAPQVSFCSGTTCIITLLYDQTSNGNNLPVSPGKSCAGCSNGIGGPGPNGSDVGANAMALPVTIGGQPAYGALFNGIGTGYRDNAAKNVPTGSQPEGIYMLTSSNLTSGSCCFDFGSAETNDSDDGNATMNAIYYGTACWTGGCSGTGPWVGGDLENGMYFSDTGPNPAGIPSESGSFVSTWEKNNGTTDFTLKYGSGQSGGLTQSYAGPLPDGYNPMKVQPSIELGTGGDNSPAGKGEFFEGAVTAGFPSDATENAVQADIVAAGYSGNTTAFSTSRSVISLKAHANGDYVDAANSTTSLIANATSIGPAETFDLITGTDGTVNLRAHSDQDWVTAENDGASPLIANRGAVGPWETFDLIHNPDGSVSLRSYTNRDIVTADDAGASPLIANRTAIGPWEEFDLIRDTVPVSLRAHANNDFVTADDAGASPLIANRTAVGSWETFDLIGNSDGSVSLRAHANNDYVTADDAGASPLIANSTAIGPWEEFDLVANPDGSISLRAHANNQIVIAANGGSSALIANQTTIGSAEEFDLVFD
ncbi:MAG TPA: arabinofuranosidase catalytic domain-containing protein [Actinocrinis sp.]|nr:arabinofuranosidase catalytic domain-containing protein [Actinocrinis sp.]